MITIAKFCIRALGWLCLAVALLLLTAWLIGQTVSDRVHASQFIAWLPSWVLLPTSGVLLLLGLFSRVGYQRSADGAQRGSFFHRAAIRATRLLMLTLLVAAVWVHWTELRWQNAVFSGGRAASPEQRVRIAHVNLDAILDAAQWRSKNGLNRVLPRPLPTIILLSSNMPRQAVREQLTELDSRYQVTTQGRFTVASTLPVVDIRQFIVDIPAPTALAPGSFTRRSHAAMQWVWDHALVPLGEGHRDFMGSQQPEPAYLTFVRIETKPRLGRDITICYVDLPSDPLMSRWTTAALVRQQLDKLENASPSERPVPKPDIMVGDFNTPRGAASLSHIARGMTHAFDQAGHGDIASFPRRSPLLHIDHLFLLPQLRATRYELAQPVMGDHWLQWADIVAR